MRGERKGHTLEPSALVNEAYLHDLWRRPMLVHKGREVGGLLNRIHPHPVGTNDTVESARSSCAAKLATVGVVGASWEGCA
jgi:hypothetical protein